MKGLISTTTTIWTLQQWHTLSIDFKKISNIDGLNNVKNVDCECLHGGRACGLAIVCDSSINVEMLDVDLNYIDMLIKSEDDTTGWMATGFYEFPQKRQKQLTCDKMWKLNRSKPII